MLCSAWCTACSSLEFLVLSILLIPSKNLGEGFQDPQNGGSHMDCCFPPPNCQWIQDLVFWCQIHYQTKLSLSLCISTPHILFFNAPKLLFILKWSLNASWALELLDFSISELLDLCSFLRKLSYSFKLPFAPKPSNFAILLQYFSRYLAHYSFALNLLILEIRLSRQILLIFPLLLYNFSWLMAHDELPLYFWIAWTRLDFLL